MKQSRTIAFVNSPLHDENCIYEFENPHRQSRRRTGNIIQQIFVIIVVICFVIFLQYVFLNNEGGDILVIVAIGTVGGLLLVYFLSKELLKLLGTQKIRIYDNGLTIFREPIFLSKSTTQIPFTNLEEWKIFPNHLINISYKVEESIEYLNIRRSEVEDFNKIKSILLKHMTILPKAG